VKEENAEVCTFVDGIGQEAAVHVRVPAWLADEQTANVVKVFERITALFQHCVAGDGPDAAVDDPERLAGGVVVDGGDEHAAAVAAARSSSHARATSSSVVRMLPMARRRT